MWQEDTFYLLEYLSNGEGALVLETESTSDGREQ